MNQNWQALRYVPASASNYKKICHRAIEQDGLAIGLIDQGILTGKLCREACLNIGKCRVMGKSGTHIVHFIPARLRAASNTQYAELVLSKCAGTDCQEKTDFSGAKASDWNRYERAVFFAPANLEMVPDSKKTFRMCVHAAARNPQVMEFVPQRFKTPQFYDELVQQGILNNVLEVLMIIPAQALTVKHLQMWLGFRDLDLALLNRFSPEKRKEALVSPNILASLYLPHKLQLVSDSRLDKISRQRIIDHLVHSHSQPIPDFKPCPREKLYEASHPLNPMVINPFLPELVASAYNAIDYSPERFSEGLDLHQYVEKNSKRPLLPISETEPLLKAKSVATAGGRTLRVTVDNEHYFYKFQRDGETLETLVSEGMVHEYLATIGSSMASGLHSDMPREPVWFKMPTDSLKGLSGFEDPIAVTKDNGREWVNVYRYKADAGYGIYAHQPDRNNQNPFTRPEQGLLRASHDIGLFTGMGLIPTSLLPAYHDTGSGRRWVALHSLLGYGNRCVEPGTFGAWNTTATEYCDIGYSGFRDIGDYELYGHIASYLNHKDTNGYCHPPQVLQRLMLANSCIENLLAVTLVYARLHHLFPEYHYKNCEALVKMRNFLEKAFTCFLKGYYHHNPAVESASFSLKQFMGLTDVDYEKWLDRTVRELVYWTAAQPDRETPAKPAFKSREYDHKDCYGLHLQEQQSMTSELYPVPLALKEYPKDFHNIHGKINLGGDTRSFPLSGLFRGLVLISAQILQCPFANAAQPGMEV